MTKANGGSKARIVQRTRQPIPPSSSNRVAPSVRNTRSENDNSAISARIPKGQMIPISAPL